MRKGKDESIVLDKFNIEPQNSTEKIEWLKSLHSKGFEGGQVVEIAAYRSLVAARANR